MKKEIQVILDTDEARSGLFLHGNFAALHKDSDEEIAEKAIEHVGKFASRFGFELAPKKPALNADLEKTVTVKVNTKIARQMLDLAGFYSAYEKSDDEVFEMVMNMMSCYGATCKISFDDA
jgi:hypothetical protein